MSRASDFKALLEPLAGEPIVHANHFKGAYGRSAILMVARPLLRTLGKGGLSARFGQANYLGVTATRVILWRGDGADLTQLADWPRAAVTGSAVRKHWTDTRQDNLMGQAQYEDGFTLRTTLSTPDGTVVIDLDEERGGRGTLRALKVPLPEVKKSWWRAEPELKRI